MKFEGVSASDQKLWEDYVSAQRKLTLALVNFLNSTSKIKIVKEALSRHNRDVLSLVDKFNENDLKEVFEELLEIAALSHGLGPGIRKLILKLPKEWLLEHIEATAEPLLSGKYPYVDDIYMMLLNLYNEIDPELTQRLAKRAIAQENPHIQEHGYDFLSDESSL